MVCYAPAKVNLFLSVGPKDERGYHPLRTEFQSVELCDKVTIEVAGKSEVTFSEPDVPPVNTVTRALRLLGEQVALPGFRLHIQKHIPTEAGLGGGSSDAATVLLAACHLTSVCLDPAELAKIALRVGADVPFFLVGGRARAEGYGEIMTPLPDGEARWFVIAQPAARCSTKEMFAKLDELSYPFREFPGSAEFYNDFERVAPPECLALIEELRSGGAEAAGLTGSGSAVFGVFRDPESAATALKQSSAPFAATAPTLGRERFRALQCGTGYPADAG